jgi:hypothetical protein
MDLRNDFGKDDGNPLEIQQYRIIACGNRIGTSSTVFGRIPTVESKLPKIWNYVERLDVMKKERLVRGFCICGYKRT